jgi:hypothetical protein
VAEDVTAVRLLLDHLPNSVPTVVYEPAITMREVTDLTEGVSYLHVQFKNAKGWGTINHYKLQIDTHAPDSFVISEVAQGVFKFDAKDSLSGIASYKVQIDDREVVDFVDNGDHLYGAPLLSAGAHTLRATAFDKAGNSISATIDFILHATLVAEIVSEPPTLKENLVEKGQLMVTILSIVIPFVALVLLLLALLYSVWHSRGGLRKRIDKEVLEAKMIVHKAFALLRDDLAEDVIALERASKKRKLTTTEAKIMKRLKQNINEAEEVISKEVDDVLTHIR